MSERPHSRLHRRVDPARDHILGEAGADITLLEYGSYTCPYCHAAHAVIADLRDRFGERMRYVFRHLPITGDGAEAAAELAEYAEETTGQFWQVHDALMKRGPSLPPQELARIAREFGLPRGRRRPPDAARVTARRRVEEDRQSARLSGAAVTPTFFINGRRYEGAWDESTLAEAMLGSLGHRLQTATVDFVRWAPSTGLLLLVMTVLAVVLVNSPMGDDFEALWRTPLSLGLGGGAFALPLREWINEGLLSVFFLVVGLEIKREFTVGRLASRRAAALPAIAAVGGMAAPAAIFLLVIPSGPLNAGWGVPIATDTAFAVALIVLLGNRVPVELRIFLTAAAIVDDLVAIVVIAVFYTAELDLTDLGLAVLVVLLLIGFNRWGIYRPLPYALAGIALWLLLHDAGVDATLAGVILALVTPTRPPANLAALMAQAEAVLRAEMALAEEPVLRGGPSEPTLIALDAIHNRIEAPADKLLRFIEPWSSYLVLPLFALANAGVALSTDIMAEHARLVAAVVLGLVVGKPVGILTAAATAVRLGIAEKPAAYSWRQLAGAAALAGIGFTMSLFIAGEAFPDAGDFAAAKIAVFAASALASVLGIALLAWPRAR